MVNSTTVEGDLVCSEGHFVAGENPTALKVNGAIIKGSVFLRDNFKAEGLVSLQSASIRGSLNCHAGQFISKNNDAAFDAYNAKIGGTVSMCHGFKAEGGVRLSDTAIGEDLRCLGGQFIAKEGAPAIDAVRLKVEGGIFFGEKSVTMGEARFSHVEASRSFEWLDVQSPEQAVLNLNFSRTGRLLNCREAWSNIGNLILDGFVYEQLDDRAPQTATIQIEWPPRNQLRRHRRLLRLRSRRRID